MRSKHFEAVKRSRAAIIAGALVFLLAQAFSAVHLAKYGADPHEHFGQPCVIALTSDQGQKLIPTASIAAIAIVFAWITVAHVNAPAPLAARVTVTRSRGPPSASSIR